MESTREHDREHAAPVVVPATGSARNGRHRIPAPPSALRGRAAVVAVAAGATVSAGSYLADLGSGFSEETEQIALVANGESEVQSATAVAPASAAAPTPSAPEAVAVQYASTPQDQMSSTLDLGTEINTLREVAEEQARRPKVVLPAHGSYTSQFAMRWGVFHGGIDLAGPEGTPEFAATDGTVIDAGPAQGFGQWVRIMSDEGVMTVYGHMNTILVTKGQRVFAGQPIALMGSQGFSTGSHLHFEVWENGGKDRIDPAPWLQRHGVDIGPYVGG